VPASVAVLPCWLCLPLCLDSGGARKHRASTESLCTTLYKRGENLLSTKIVVLYYCACSGCVKQKLVKLEVLCRHSSARVCDIARAGHVRMDPRIVSLG